MGGDGVVKKRRRKKSVAGEGWKKKVASGLKKNDGKSYADNP